MIAPARVAAFEALSAIDSGRHDLPSAIAYTRDILKDDRDKALTADIVTGVQRWRLRLDHLIAHFARRKIERLDPEVLEILRLGAYQLLHLSRVPAAATVDDAVAMTGKAGKRSASGLVNAVLRAISRGKSQLPLPARPTTEDDRDSVLDYLSITLSHPRWLAERWWQRLGLARAEAWMLFNNGAAPLTLRNNPRDGSVEALMTRLIDRGVTTVRGRYGADALIVQQGRPLTDPGSDAGWFVVQDEASQLVAALAGDHPDGPVLDTCASPGGKTTAIAAVLAPGQIVVACDVRARRLDLLKRTVAQTRSDNVRIVHADLLTGLPFASPFGCVLLDAPCSGLGTLRRDPDIKWRRTPSDVAVLAAAQQRMLDQAAAAVAPRGRLVYATCSTEPEENELLARDFLSRRQDYRQLEPSRISSRLAPELFDPEQFFRTEPDRHGLEGFFGAVFERTARL